jgi:hypothetical protein
MRFPSIACGSVLVFIIVGCATKSLAPQTDRVLSSNPSPVRTNTLQSIPYSVLTSKDESMPDRKRLFFSIAAPDAKTFMARGQTVVTAAMELRRNNQADVVEVWLEPSENTRGLGLVLAVATYSPDGKGMSGMERGEIWYNVTATVISSVHVPLQ